MILDKKQLVLYKKLLKRMLIAASKYGVGSKENPSKAYIYNIIFEDVLYPVVYVNQDTNPWGEEFYPARLYIVSENLPSLVDITSYKPKGDLYDITVSYLVSVGEFKSKTIDTIKDLEVIEEDGMFRLTLPDIEVFSSNVDAYASNLYNNQTIKLVDESIRTLIDKEDEINSIIRSLDKETQFEFHTGDMQVRLFTMTSPLKFNRLAFRKHSENSNGITTSTVHLEQYIDDVIIHNFYKYVDIWTDIGGEDGHVNINW